MTARPDPGPVVLGIDLDGVCADFYTRLREIAANWFEKKVRSLTRSVSYDLAEWGFKGERDKERLFRYAVTQHDLFATCPMIRGTRRYLRRLSDQGYHIRIITNRLFLHYSHATAARQTTEWLDKHGIPYWDLCFMRDKDQVGADIYVDDSEENLTRLHNDGHRVICFENSTNKHLRIGHRARTWAEVYRIIKDLEPKSRTQNSTRGKRLQGEPLPLL